MSPPRSSSSTSRRSSTNELMAGSSAATARGVIGRLTRRRIVVCSGGSIITIGAARPSNIAMLSGSGVNPFAEEKVALSRTASKTSAKRESTQNGSNPGWSKLWRGASRSLR